MKKYYNNYPYCHKSEMRKNIIYSAIFYMPFYGLSVFGLIFHFLSFLSERNIWNLAGILILGTSSVYFIRSFVMSLVDSTKGRIVLYFDNYRPKENDGEWAYLYGSELAKNLKFIDSYLKNKGKTPLSDFGFHDDYWDGQNEWKQPEEMLDSLLCVKEGISSKGLPSSPALEKEVLVYINKLERAKVEQFQCRLIYRNGTDTAITPMYMEQREGRFP